MNSIARVLKKKKIAFQRSLLQVSAQKLEKMNIKPQTLEGIDTRALIHLQYQEATRTVREDQKEKDIILDLL